VFKHVERPAIHFTWLEQLQELAFFKDTHTRRCNPIRQQQMVLFSSSGSAFVVCICFIAHQEAALSVPISATRGFWGDVQVFQGLVEQCEDPKAWQCPRVGGLPILVLDLLLEVCSAMVAKCAKFGFPQARSASFCGFELWER
jgi:hypothetical protein